MRKCERCLLDETFHINGTKVYMRGEESVCEFPGGEDAIPFDDGINVLTLQLILSQAGRGCEYCCVKGKADIRREIELKYGGKIRR
jgi:hypothetical protein